MLTQNLSFQLSFLHLKKKYHVYDIFISRIKYEKCWKRNMMFFYNTAIQINIRICSSVNSVYGYIFTFFWFNYFYTRNIYNICISCLFFKLINVFEIELCCYYTPYSPSSFKLSLLFIESSKLSSPYSCQYGWNKMSPKIFHDGSVCPYRSECLATP